MKRILLLPMVLGACSMAQAGVLWHLPPNEYFDFSHPLKMRGDGKLAVYWSPSSSLPGIQFMQRTLLDPKTGRELQSDQLPGELQGGDGIVREAWGAQQTHAFLPSNFGGRDRKTWLRLKKGGSYLVLLCLPRFDENSLHDIAFTPDVGTLYVLGQNRLWKVGAQSGRLLRVVDAPNGRWSRENAALSPDARQIVAMRDRVTLFSTRTGHIVRRFGVGLETITGHCGSLQARVGFSPDGRCLFAQEQGDETWVYSRRGTQLWHGEMPLDIVFSPDSRVIDTPISRDGQEKDVVLRRLNGGLISARVPGLHTDHWGTPLAFTPDNRTLFYVQNGAVNKMAWSPEARSHS